MARRSVFAALDAAPGAAEVTASSVILFGGETAQPPVQIAPLALGGKFFTAADEPWRWKGASQFALCHNYSRGDDITPVLRAYEGYNLLRVWNYVPVKDWGARAWDANTPDEWITFLRFVAGWGFYVELTLLTDDDPVRIPQARELVNRLSTAQPRPVNLVIEIGNEPQVNKNINTRALKADLDTSGFLYASGDSSAQAFGSYGTLHTARDSEWPRRAHDLLEYWNGGGPDFPTDPAHKCPAIADEPIRPDQSGYVETDYRAYAGACALLGAGMTFHSETGKYGLPPTPDEARCATASLAALDAFPADAPNGPYSRPVENSLRTYVVGPYMVRIRPTTPNAPEPGWTPLDADGILWRR